MFSPLTPPSFQNWPQDDGYVVRGRVWNANAPSTRTPILYLHGIQSHGGWYEWSASVLASQGQTVMMPDRR
ncbi:MAG: lysophospholipase, partial [Phycisphaerae bacterium]